jgi:hypothetical protein
VRTNTNAINATANSAKKNGRPGFNSGAKGPVNTVTILYPLDYR